MKVTSLEVSVPRRGGPLRYPVVLGAGALVRLPRVISTLGPSRIHVVSDSRVWSAWGKKLGALLEGGVPLARTVVPAGERSKSASTLARVWRDLVRAGCDRRSLVIAFGGGVVGDLAGFAAASALRGLDLIQVPTTLLAMVDASVGGKTGINLKEGKNLVGAFHQPRAVVIDLDFLDTLPPRELRAGWAEVIKTAAIRDASLFRYLETRAGPLLGREPGPLLRVVRACLRIKAGVVRRDEREGGLRMLLNFGHTLAHALEAVGGYRGLLHGEAVAMGMAFAARLGESQGTTERGTAARLERLLGAYGLPVAHRSRAPGPLLLAMERDKKRGHGGLRWVLLRRIGRAEIHDKIPPSLIRRALETQGQSPGFPRKTR